MSEIGKYPREKEYSPFQDKYSGFIKNEDIRDVMFQILKILSETDWYDSDDHDGRMQVFSFTTDDVLITRLALNNLIKIAPSPDDLTAPIQSAEAKAKLSAFDGYLVSDGGGCALTIIDTRVRYDMLKEYIGNIMERGYM